MSETKTSIAQYYHERTKYDPETIATKGRALDWDQQPSAFKVYQVGKVYDLKMYLTEDTPNNFIAEKWQRLSRLLLCSYGLTARIRTVNGDMYLRSAPSAGGLYPAEVYIIANNRSFLPPGIYNYQPQTHALVHFWESDQVWERLQVACFTHPVFRITDFAIATTGVFYRSAWRYQDRAYRRIFLDTGHLLGNIELAGAINDFRPYLLGGFDDQVVNDLLYLDKTQEGAIAIIPILDLKDDLPANSSQIAQILTTAPTALASGTNTDYPRLADGELLGYLHQATEIHSEIQGAGSDLKIAKSLNNFEDKYNFPFCTKVSTVTNSLNWGTELEDLESTILKRRSTRAFTGEPLSLEQLNTILDFVYQPIHYINQGLDGEPDYFDLSLIETFIAVSAVTGLEDGCYYYAPITEEFRQIRFKNFRKELHFLCLGQDLGRDASAVIFHTADLKKAIEKYGDRSYRYLHLDAGHLGQRLNLAAIQLGLGVSGIAGFFDDQVNEVLGIPTDEAVLYITTLGYPN
ncbi:SagB-type dehydrogenase domain protein [Synechococcus sp. PCC 7502]|uniref:SagB/ThcOx family dehydrogenase n=1 Tax=Synechococcus sp. PCC 7502 TaxID=1173263 RepID=UPI00029FAF99|nr:SagB/ThcOx family dehydrogenase [Synechococcus sp. PCC 7502]AFY74067.1 SagB-type dehydrogenase domain protein [Synechococcus sp. PCC 7502]